MSLQTREFHAHIEMLRHVQQDDGQCAVGCGEWSMAHVAARCAHAVSLCIAAELETSGLLDAALKVWEGA